MGLNRDPSLVIANSSSPELGWLAVRAQSRRRLRFYCRPYIRRDRWWERLLSHRRLATRFGSILTRRATLPEVDPSLITEAGLAADLAFAATVRLAARGVPLANRIAAAASQARSNAVGRRTARGLPVGCTVVAANGCAAPIFRRTRSSGARYILNFPAAHPHHVTRVIREERVLQPHLAAAIDDQWPKKLIRRYLSEIDLADIVLVGSSFSAQTFVNAGYPAERLRVSPFGVDTRLFRPDRMQERSDGVFRVLFVGQLSQRKGLSYLLDAYELIRGSHTRLTVVGNPTVGWDLFKARCPTLEHRYHVPQTRLPDVYRSADVLVLPSLAEGMPLVVLEAMASGLPVIVTPTGADEVVRHDLDGLIVPIRDVEAIATGLECLAANTRLRQDMGRHAAERASQFTWDAYADRVLDVAW